MSGPNRGLDISWQEQQGSNLQPLVLETNALPIELCPYVRALEGAPIPRTPSGKLAVPGGGTESPRVCQWKSCALCADAPLLFPRYVRNSITCTGTGWES